MAQDLALQLKIKALVEGANEVKRLHDQVGQIGRQSRQPFGDPARQLAAGATRARQAVGSLTRNVFSLRGALAGLGVGILVKGFLDVGREIENVGVRMRFLTRSAAEAAEATRALRDFAGTSPFELREVSAAAPVLLTVADSVDELRKLLEITGDIAAVTGLSFAETAQQIQRSMSSGINSADLFRERGVRSMLGFAAGVETSAAETKRHIFDLWFGPGGATNTLKGASAAMAQTWDGAVSMLQDKWFAFRAVVVGAAPFEFLKASMQELDAQAAESFGSIEAAGEQMGRELVLAMQNGIIGAAALADQLSGVAAAASAAVGDIWSAWKRLPTELQTFGVLAVLMFGKRGVLAVGGVLAGIEAVRKAAAETIDQVNAGVRARGIEPPTTLFPARRDQAAGRIERAGQTPPPDDGLDPDSFEARVRRILDAINKRIAANRELAQAQKVVAGGGAPSAGADADPKATAKAAEALAKSQDVIAGLRQQIDLYGQTSGAAKLRYDVEHDQIAGLLPQHRAAALALVDQLELLERQADAEKDRVELMQRGTALTEQARTGQEQLNAALAEYQALLAAGAIGQETYRRLAEAAQDAFEAQDAGVQLTQRLRTEQEIYNAAVAEYVRLLQQGSITQDTFARAVESAAEKLKGQADEMSEFAIQAARNIQSAFADFLFDPFSQGLQGMLSGFVDVLRRMASEAIASKIGERLFGDLLKTGASAAAGGGDNGLLGGLLAGLFHTGGVAGVDAAPGRRVPAVMYALAPRYHGGGIAGLAPDEVPAVLRRDEEVLTRDDPRHRFNGGIASAPPQVTVRNVNLFDTQVIGDYLSTSAGEKVVLNVVSRNKAALGIT